MIVEIARVMYAAARDRYAYMPPHRWRVSTDVLQELYAAAPPNSTATPGVERTLFGCRVDLDMTLGPGTLLLEAVE